MTWTTDGNNFHSNYNGPPWLYKYFYGPNYYLTSFGHEENGMILNQLNSQTNGLFMSRRS